MSWFNETASSTNVETNVPPLSALLNWDTAKGINSVVIIPWAFVLAQ